MKQSILILTILICGLLLVGCKGSKSSARTGPPKSDVDFAKEVFRLLADGDQSVADLIDWDNLSVAGIDAGGNYKSMTTEASKETFRNSFIKGYSTSFKNSGGNPNVLKNWREQSKDGSKTIVAADGPNGKTLLLTVVHTNGQQYVSTLDIK